ncbi:MAG: hypothetical protein AAGD25_39005 [Cyanobacteria bacterium P01_F01_bin.150]
MSESSFTDVASSNVSNAHPVLQNVPEISLQTIPSIVSEAGTREERTITNVYTVNGPLPDGGISVLLSLEKDFPAFFTLGFDRVDTDEVDTFENLQVIRRIPELNAL